MVVVDAGMSLAGGVGCVSDAVAARCGSGVGVFSTQGEAGRHEAVEERERR